MRIDGRELGSNDLLNKLKQMLSSNRECRISVDIMVNSVSDVQRVTGFVSMSGCTAEFDKKENYYIIHVRGFPCCS